MAVKYADRAFLYVNGTPLLDIQSATLTQTQNRKPVASMTNDRYNRGFVQGNIDIDITCTIAVRNKAARPKLEAIDYENVDVQIAFYFGADKFICTGVFLKDGNDSAGGIGDEVKTTYNFGALKITDAVGNSASIFNISL